jgi:hypothetical protein
LFAVVCGAGFFFSAAAPVAGDEPPKVSSRVVPNDANVANGANAVNGANGVAANANAANAPASQLLPFLQMARSSRATVAAVRDYEATFTKQELVGRTLYSGRMFLKLRNDPFSVYLRFIDQNNGREVLYAGPRYQYKLWAHEAPGTLSGMIGSISLEPNSARAMAEGRHPITEIGMVKMMDGLIGQWEAESKWQDPQDPKVFYYPNAKLAGEIECKAAITRHENSQHSYRFYETRIFFDKQSNFPIRLEQYGTPDQAHPQGYLVEQYIYTNIRTNVGLSDNDFDTRNRNYHF